VKIQLPPLLNGSEAICLPLEKSPVFTDQDFADMVFADIAPAGFFVYGRRSSLKLMNPMLSGMSPNSSGLWARM